MHSHCISNSSTLFESVLYIVHERISKFEPDLKDLNEMEIASYMFEEQQTS